MYDLFDNYFESVPIKSKCNVIIGVLYSVLFAFMISFLLNDFSLYFPKSMRGVDVLATMVGCYNFILITVVDDS